jgi:hypothetical protein
MVSVLCTSKKLSCLSDGDVCRSWTMIENRDGMNA